MPQSKISLIALGVTVLALFGLGIMLLLNTPEPAVQTRGQAVVGGPFEMVDHTGRVVTEQDFLGRPFLLFFGFTYCPDVCPLTMEIITAGLDLLGPQAEQVQPIFVTVDPERDRPEVLAAYLKHFDDRLIGLTGSAEQVAGITKTYHVYYKKRVLDGGEGTYLMDHSSLIYLMDEDGGYVTHLAQVVTPEDFAEKVRPFLEKP